MFRCTFPGLAQTRGLRFAAGLVAGLLLAVTAPLRAEPLDYFLVDGVSYDGAITTPDDALGHGLGDKPVRYEGMVRYLRGLADQSDRVTVETIGFSHEGRPILFFVVSSPENLARIDEIRQAHLERAASGAGGTDGPVVTWINYGVHGAESSGMDAAVPTLYHLAAAQGPEIDETLENSVILITAIFNPDGHSRRVDHVERFSATVPVADPFHVQHDLWIEARTNHYWFDLNRQWLLQSQPESKAWLAKWHYWKPNLTADYHEMGSDATYYFHPGTPTRRNPLIPDEARRLAGEIAQYHADFMDSEAKLYFSEELFDNFYIGKGSTYPQINGSVGFLFEAGAARGGVVESIDGDKTYANNIRNHFRTSLTSIQGALDKREELLRFQQTFFRETASLAQNDREKGYVFAAPGDPSRLALFVDLLERHDVRVHALQSRLTVGGNTYEPGEAYAVRLNQPQYRMIKGIFQTADEFEEAIFYDVSGWTLPLAYGLTYNAVTSGLFGDSLDTALGDPVDSAADLTPRYGAPPRAPYGYMFDWGPYYAPRALYRLLDADLLVRAAFEPVTVETAGGPVDFERGAVFVPLENQEMDRDGIHALVSALAAEDGVEVHAVTSGLTPTPGRDLGARGSVQPLNKPTVLLLFDEGLSYYDTGEIWHLLDHRMRIPVVLQRQSDLRRADWSRYTHIMLAGGRVSLSKGTQERLDQWIREGGVLIAARQTAQWAQHTFLLSDKEKEAIAQREDAEAAETDAPERYDYADLSLKSAEHVIGGTIFASDLDISHPLGFGYRKRALASHRNTTLVLERPKNPVATVARYTAEPRLSGYASDRRLGEIAGTPMAIAERHGAGAVVLFADNLAFRGTFLGTNKMLLNALFFAGQVRTPNFGGATDQGDVH